MRRMEVIATSLLWIAVAMLMPMAVLEPVQGAHAAATPAAAAHR